MKETGSNGVCDIGSNPDSTVDLTALPLQPSMSAICLTVVVSVVFPSKGCYEDYLVINNCIYAGDDNDLYSFTKCFLLREPGSLRKLAIQSHALCISVIWQISPFLLIRRFNAKCLSKLFHSVYAFEHKF